MCKDSKIYDFAKSHRTGMRSPVMVIIFLGPINGMPQNGKNQPMGLLDTLLKIQPKKGNIIEAFCVYLHTTFKRLRKWHY